MLQWLYCSTSTQACSAAEAIFSCAIYSDDGGATWQVSGFFPEGYTEEAALVELHDGRIYYNSRSKP